MVDQSLLSSWYRLQGVRRAPDRSSYMLSPIRSVEMREHCTTNSPIALTNFLAISVLSWRTVICEGGDANQFDRCHPLARQPFCSLTSSETSNSALPESSVLTVIFMAPSCLWWLSTDLQQSGGGKRKGRNTLPHKIGIPTCFRPEEPLRMR